MIKQEICLRSARPEDLNTLRRWDSMPHISASIPNDDWQWEKELGCKPVWREQFIAELDQQPIGFLQIIDPAQEESHYWGKIQKGLRAIDLWIGDEKNLAKGYGSQMMRMALPICFSDPEVIAVLVDPLSKNLKARRFYQQHGFELLFYRWFGKDHCAVYRLTRANWKQNGETPAQNHEKPSQP